MFNVSDIKRDAFMLKNHDGYDWYWHSFTAHNAITNEEKAFFIEFFIINPSLKQDYPLFGKDGKPSYLMIKVGTWGKDKRQVHRFFGLNNVTIGGSHPFYIKTDDCYLSEDKTYGYMNIKDSINHPETMSDDGTFYWNLKINKEIAFNVGYGASEPLRDMDAFEMFWHVEGMKTRYEGEIYFNNEKYVVRPEDCYGYADKNWGKDFTSPWVWLSSNNLTSSLTHKKLNNSAFDIGGGRPKIGNIALDKKLLGAFYYEGKCYEFNFSKFWTLTKTEFEFKELEDEVYWHVVQETPIHKMETNIFCDKKDMLFINYEAPDGSRKHKRLWNGGNGKGFVKLYEKDKLIDEILCENVGCEYGEYERSDSN